MSDFVAKYFLFTSRVFDDLGQAIIEKTAFRAVLVISVWVCCGTGPRRPTVSLSAIDNTRTSDNTRDNTRT